jgi:hypothetical protein
MKIAVLMGAGASYGAGAALPHVPPLGNQLYSHLVGAFPNTWGALLSGDEQAAFLDEARPFERGMELLSGKRDERLQLLLIDMGIYFARFVPLPLNGYHVFLWLIERTPGVEWAFCSLNYDALFEQAMWQRLLCVRSLGQLTPEEGRTWLSLSKPHGSCNYILRGTTSISNVRMGGGFGQYAAGHLAVELPQAVEPMYRTLGPTIPPAMSLFERRKENLVAREAFDAIRREWVIYTSEADVILCIGVKPTLHDEHIWTPVIESSARVWFIGGQDQALKELASYVARRLQHLGSTFREGLVVLRHALPRL